MPVLDEFAAAGKGDWEGRRNFYGGLVFIGAGNFSRNMNGIKFLMVTATTVAVWWWAGPAWGQGEAEKSDGPYAAIVARNVFGLRPKPVDEPVPQAPADPPPKITPDGIMDIFGRLQALYKVKTTGGAGRAPKDEMKSYVLAEGEREDGIEVVKIDRAAGVITFDNHGTTQELPLVEAKETDGAGQGEGVAARHFPMPRLPNGMARANWPVPRVPGFGQFNPGAGFRVPSR